MLKRNGLQGKKGAHRTPIIILCSFKSPNMQLRASWAYFGVAKTHAQTAMAAIGQNLLKAANKITLNPQNLAIV